MKAKKENKLKLKIKELKKTSKGRAYLRLIMWCIFFLVLFVFCIISSLMMPSKPAIDKDNDANKTPIEEKTKTVKEMIEELINNTYDFTYEVNLNGVKYTYNGKKNTKDTSGYKETNTEIIKYMIDEGGTYQLIGEEKVLITNLYEGLNNNYFDLNYLANIINSHELEENKECDCIYPVYDILIDEIKYSISTNKESISSINITSPSFTYYLNFTNIGGEHE